MHFFRNDVRRVGNVSMIVLLLFYNVYIFDHRPLFAAEKAGEKAQLEKIFRCSM